ncbi:MAG: multiheme c-type cytochrome [Planctomycetota bacterium]
MIPRLLVVGCSGLILVLSCKLWGDQHDRASGEALPSVAVIITGDDDGYLKPCECTNGMLGGMPRRHSLVKALERKATSQLLLSNGRVTSPHTEFPVDKEHAAGTLVQDQMKFATMLVAMEEIGYRAINVSPWELKLGREELANAAKDVSFPLLATNLRLEPEPKLALAKGVKVPWPGGEALVVGVIGFSQQRLLGDADPGATLAEPLASIRKAQAELGKGLPLIVLAQMDAKEGLELAKQLPELVVMALPGAAASSEETPSALTTERPFLVTTGSHGKYLGVAYLSPGETTAFKFEWPAVESTLFDSGDIVSLLNLLQQRLKAENLLGRFYEKKPTVQGRTYVGSAECGNCHPKAVEALADSKHMHAWQTLVDKGYTADPDCVGCHVTGYGYQTGFAGEEKTPSLINVTCEECHGPGSLHMVSPEQPYDIQKRACDGCHNNLHSPSFRKGVYWPKIKHGRD